MSDNSADQHLAGRRTGGDCNAYVCITGAVGDRDIRRFYLSIQSSGLELRCPGLGIGKGHGGFFASMQATDGNVLIRLQRAGDTTCIQSGKSGGRSDRQIHIYRRSPDRPEAFGGNASQIDILVVFPGISNLPADTAGGHLGPGGNLVGDSGRHNSGRRNVSLYLKIPDFSLQCSEDRLVQPANDMARSVEKTVETFDRRPALHLGHIHILYHQHFRM